MYRGASRFKAAWTRTALNGVESASEVSASSTRTTRNFSWSRPSTSWSLDYCDSRQWADHRRFGLAQS